MPAAGETGAWTGGRAVECSGLENRQTFTGLVGSNPTLSVGYTRCLICDVGHVRVIFTGGRMSRVRRLVICAAAIIAGLVHSTDALAQAALPGSRVRIVPVNGDTRREGTLVVMTDDSLSYRPGLSDAMLTMPMDSVRTVFVSDGLHSRTGHTLRSGLIGAGIGFGLGAIITAGSCVEDAGKPQLLPCNVGYVLLGVPLTAAGFIGGVLIGRGHKSDNWERVYDRSRSTSLIVGPSPRGGLALGVSIPFGSAQDSR